MDVDTAPPAPSAAAAGGESSARSIKIHPLAIIGISDHHTRVVTGGSALPPSAPVVGLLFGYYHSADGSSGSSGRDVSIVDAEEMVYPKTDNDSHRAAILLKIELHQKVFPQHKVVGWYRVQGKQGDDNAMNVEVLPSEEDLRMNQSEMIRYCSSSSSSGEGSAGGEDEDVESPLFVLMNAVPKSSDNGRDKKPSSSSNAEEEMELDEELPLTVYESLADQAGAGGGAVFVNADFELETYEPERIAVEKVFKTQPSKSAAASAAASSKDAASAKQEEGDRKSGKKSKKDESNKPKKPSFTRGPTELDSQLESLQSSIRAMNVRMNVLLEFLQSVQRGEITPEDSLLRSVDGLVRQLPLVLAALDEGQASSATGSNGRKPLRELDNEYSNTMLLTYLAAVAKTAKSVHVYSEKFRNAVESGKADPRRPMY